jgi:hypothetical protein
MAVRADVGEEVPLEGLGLLQPTVGRLQLAGERLQIVEGAAVERQALAQRLDQLLVSQLVHLIPAFSC